MITPSFGLTATERVLPRLALDFTTAVLDSRVTFTRTGNTATVVNSSGLVAPINANLPRFDFDPITLACKGLLIEETRTNLSLRSAEFTNATWYKINVTDTANTTTAPDGTTTADTITANGTNNIHFVGQDTLTAAGSATVLSVFAKADTNNFIQIFYGGDNTSFVNFNISTGAVGTAGGTATGSIVSFGNGWYRCIAVNTSILVTSIGIGLVSSSSSARIPALAISTSVFLWGAQLEAGAFSTSYIPTVATAVTRNADVATMTGTNFSSWYNASESTLMAEASTFSNAATDKFVANINNNGFPNRILMNFSATNNFSASLVSNSISQVSGTNGTSAALNTPIKMCFATKLDSFAFSQSGVAPTTDNLGVMPVTVDRLWIGSAFTSAYLNGHVQQIKYWPQRLINAEVQAFSK